MPDADLDAMVSAAHAGGRDAFAQLWEALHPALLRYFRARIGWRDAEDVASEVWLGAARNLGIFQGDGEAFRRWLFTIGHRRMVDELRRNHRHPTTTAPRDAAREIAEPATTHLEEIDRAIALVRRLPTAQADAVLLRVVADLDVACVAELMGRSEGAIRLLTHRGLHRLAEGGLHRDGVPETGGLALGE